MTNLTKFLIVCCALFMVACATPGIPTNVQTQQGYNVLLEQVHEITRYGSSSKIYFDPYSTKNGALYVEIHRITLESANLEDFSYILKKNNKIISRWHGEWEQAEIPTSIGGRWWNIVEIDTKGPLTPGIYTLKVKDDVAAVDVRTYPYDEFKITVTK